MNVLMGDIGGVRQLLSRMISLRADDTALVDGAIELNEITRAIPILEDNKALGPMGSAQRFIRYFKIS